MTLGARPPTASLSPEVPPLLWSSVSPCGFGPARLAFVLGGVQGHGGAFWNSPSRLLGAGPLGRRYRALQGEPLRCLPPPLCLLPAPRDWPLLVSQPRTTPPLGEAEGQDTGVTLLFPQAWGDFYVQARGSQDLLRVWGSRWTSSFIRSADIH